MTKLSVNINKIATLRNARGGNMPSVTQAVIDCQDFGAQGITVHPRPDERHIRYQDVRDIQALINTELNIEGYPSEGFMQLVLEVQPHQVTLVPDAPDAITSNAGWDTLKHKSYLRELVEVLQQKGIRSSIFVDADTAMVQGASELGANRVELYTEPYAAAYTLHKEKAILPFVEAAHEAHRLGLGVNAGHDLNLENLTYFAQKTPHLLEVSIGHALICDALYYGLQNTVQLYLRALKNATLVSA
ncbi:MAG: pyridoxine 5'-phosphate synthase [Bacteroidales bacterium]